MSSRRLTMQITVVNGEPLTAHDLESAIDAPVRLCEIPLVEERISHRCVRAEVTCG